MDKRLLHYTTYFIVGLFYALGMPGILTGKVLYALIKALLSLVFK